MYLKKTKILIRKDVGTPMLTAALFTIAKIRKPEDVVCIYNGMLLSHKKNEILPFVTTWIDLECIILSEISQKEKNKYRILTHICGI